MLIAMPVITYTEPDTNIRYDIDLSKAEAIDISTANPMIIQRISLPDSGGSITLDGQGNAFIVCAKGKKSSAYARELIKEIKQALKDEEAP